MSTDTRNSRSCLHTGETVCKVNDILGPTIISTSLQNCQHSWSNEISSNKDTLLKMIAIGIAILTEVTQGIDNKFENI